MAALGGLTVGERWCIPVSVATGHDVCGTAWFVDRQIHAACRTPCVDFWEGMTDHQYVRAALLEYRSMQHLATADWTKWTLL
jgi:hypothetical protein